MQMEGKGKYVFHHGCAQYGEYVGIRQVSCFTCSTIIELINLKVKVNEVRICNDQEMHEHEIRHASGTPTHREVSQVLIHHCFTVTFTYLLF